MSGASSSGALIPIIAGALGMKPFSHFTGALIPFYDPYKNIKVKNSEPGYKPMARYLHTGDTNSAIGSAKDFASRLGGFLYPLARHHHLIADDGSNTGFGPDGQFIEDPKYMSQYVLDTGLGDVKFSKKAIEDGLLKRFAATEAIEQMRRDDPDLYGDVPDRDEYSVLLNNCHDNILDIMWHGAGYSGR